VVLAPGAVAAKKCGIARRALALAGLVGAAARGVQPLGRRVPSASGLATLGATTAISPALSLAVGPTVGGAPILLAGTSPPPSAGCGAALGATVPDLGVGGLEELLAPLE
jgi:hypothetical protein